MKQLKTPKLILIYCPKCGIILNDKPLEEGYHCYCTQPKKKGKGTCNGKMYKVNDSIPCVESSHNQNQPIPL